jgi:TctA family transporter
MIDALMTALGNFANLQMWALMMLGVIWGLAFGLIPGVGSLTAMALFLPFIYKTEPMVAMPIIVTLATVGFQGGSITAILLGVPGEAPNIATTLDGFPMTKKGQGARAIGIALTGSVIGGILAAFLALGMVFAVLPFVMALTSSEMVFVILVGLAFICVLGKGSMLKGLISGGLGLLFSSVGLAGATGEPRFTFDFAFLFDGLHLVPVTLGLFAVPPMIELSMKDGSGTIASSDALATDLKGVWEGAKDFFKHKMLAFISIIIGYVFGVIPGVGASAAVFVAYGQAKQTSKHPELFGTGIVEGVIAPESCNNAKEAGSMLTTLALGIPGSGTGAMMLGALIMMGFYPGPEMLTAHMDFSLTVLIIMAVANVICTVICIFLAPHLTLIAKTPGRILVPIVFVVIFAGSYCYQGYFEDLVILLIFSVIGFLSRKFGYNPAGMFLGYILGKLFENYLFVSLQLGGALFFLRPICLFLIFSLIVFFVWEPVKKKLKNRVKKEDPR